MNRKEIIRAMRSACDKDKVDAWINDFWTITQEELERFAALVTAKEREECAKMCEARVVGDHNREDAEAKRCAAAIRARGEK